MKTTTTFQTERRAQVQSEQVFGAQAEEFDKSIVLRFSGRKQARVFPFAMKHANASG